MLLSEPLLIKTLLLIDFNFLKIKLIKNKSRSKFNINSTDGEKKLWKCWNKNIPKKISNKSDNEQTKQTINTYFFLRPCSITNIFWAPIAKIKLRPVRKPKNK